MGYYVTDGRFRRYGIKGSNEKIWGDRTMIDNSIENNVEILSNHYIKRFEQLLDNEQQKDAMSIMQEYVCNGEVEKDDYQWFYVNYQFQFKEEK